MASPEQAELAGAPRERSSTILLFLYETRKFVLRRRSALLFLLAISCTIALRLIPFDPPVVRDWAELSIRRQISSQIAARAPETAATPSAEIDRLISANRAKLAPVRRALERQYRDAITFEGADGRRHVYLGAEDGYYWLQLARSYLDHGTVCDRIEQGECIDALGNAPLGQRIEYVHSPHVFLIAGLHRLLSWIEPGSPLSVAGMLLPLLLSALALVPAFLLAARFGGPLGGFVGATAIFANSFVLGRTVDGTADVWAVGAPLFIIWLTCEALGAQRWPGRLARALLAGAILGLFAAVWKGWAFFGLVILAGLAAYPGWIGLRVVLRRGRAERLRQSLVVPAALLLAGAVGFALVSRLFLVTIDLAWIYDQVAGMLRLQTAAPGKIDAAPWPYIFATVGELASVRAAVFTDAVGPVAFGLGLIGLAVGFLPRRLRRPWIQALILGAAIAGAWSLGRFDAGRLLALPAFALPSLATLILGALRDRGDEEPTAAARLICLAWLGATLVMGFEANRYVMLAMVPLGISAGAAIGQIGSDLAAWSAARSRGARWTAPIAVLGLAGLVLGPIVAAGYAEMRSHVPRVNSAWVATFRGIKQATAPSSIVDIWWDYGHWAKYFSERPVTTDGASLLDRTPLWLARALAAPDDDESVRLLRMLNCGDVVDPVDGSRARPYETLARWGGDEALAFRTVTSLARLPRAQHGGYLTTIGLAPARSAALLRTVDCTPPDSRLVLTTAMLGNRSWYVEGFWDPYRAYLVELARRLPEDRAAAAAAAKFDLPAASARALIAAAAKVQSEEALLDFAAPEGRRAFSTGWQPCMPEGARFRCPLDFGGDSKATRIVGLVYDTADPRQARLSLAESPAKDLEELPPQLIEIAWPERLAGYVPSGRTVPGTAVLIDPEAHRVFIAPPSVLRSTLVRLVLLDGRYSPRFQKTQDHLAFDGERITSWRILRDHP